MPIISQFYGIIIRIYFNDTEQHYLEHIHVQYNEYDAVYSIKNNVVIAGNIPSKQHKLVSAWIEIHKELNGLMVKILTQTIYMKIAQMRYNINNKS